MLQKLVVNVAATAGLGRYRDGVSEVCYFLQVLQAPASVNFEPDYTIPVY